MAVSFSESSHFYTVLVQVQVPTFYFPSHGSGSGSYRYIIVRNFFKLSFFSQFSSETVWKQVDFA